MTAQIPDQLIIDLPGVDIGALQLYALIRGIDPTINYGWGDEIIKHASVSAILASHPNQYFTALHRGHIGSYRLQSDKRLLLEKISCYTGITIDQDDEPKIQFQDYLVNEIIAGDFWLVMKSQFFGRRTYIPATDGKVIINKKLWVIEGEEPTE